MRPYQLAVLFSTLFLEATLLAAIVLRKRYSACLSFPLYVAAVFLPTLLFAVWPERFYTWENYILKEIVHNLLKFAVALELAYRTFRSFPGAVVAGRRLVGTIFLLMAVVALTVLTSPPDPTKIQVEWYAGILFEWHARMLNGTIWLFTAIAVVVLWYRLPVDPFHKAILVGFVPYLLIFSVGMRALVEMGESARWLQRTHTLAYLALLFYWNIAAWSRAPASVASPRQPHQAGQPEPA